MIVKKFYIQDLDLRYFVGIGCLKIDFNVLLKQNIINQEKALNNLFDLCKSLENPNYKVTIQFFNNKYLLCQDHLFMACYHVVKAFVSGTTIANTKNLELLLYLSANRQINRAIDSFGISYNDLKSGELTYCVISENDDSLKEINKELINMLDAEEIDISFEQQDVYKINDIQQYFEITNEQINVVLNSFNTHKGRKESELSLKSRAIYDLICEKMSLLSTEKTSGN